ANGYSSKPVCQPVSRGDVGKNGLDPIISKAMREGQRRHRLSEMERDLAVAAPFVKGQPAFEAAILREQASLRAAEDKADLTDSELRYDVEHAERTLAAARPAMQSYVAHLVGYGHIDFQWLWEWQEAEV